MTKVESIKGDCMSKNILCFVLNAVLLTGCNSNDVQDKESSVYETSLLSSQTNISVSNNIVSSEEMISYETSVDVSSDSNTELIVSIQEEKSISSPTKYIDTSTNLSSIETKTTTTNAESTSISYVITEVPNTSELQSDNGESDEGGIH